MHFTLIRATAAQAREAIEHAGSPPGNSSGNASESAWHLPATARLLRPGERLFWPELTGDNHFVIPLLAPRDGTV